MKDTFFIGYAERAPQELTRWLISISAFLLILSAIVGFLLARSQNYFGESVFEYGITEIYVGQYSASPAPMLTVASDNGEQPSTYLLVMEGKHGAAESFENYKGKSVSFDGTKIYRGKLQMLEVRASSIAGAPETIGVARIQPKYVGHVILRGEIVDSKCFLGVMNPGEKTVHRACGELCIRGGIPPLLILRDQDGAVTQLLLTGPSGEAINQIILPFVAQPVRVAGEMYAYGDLLELRIDPGAVLLLRGPATYSETK